MNEESALTALGSISNQTRLRILKSLVTAGADGMTAGDIAVTVAASPSRASFHLNQLSEAGLIKSFRRARQIIYTVDFGGVAALVRYLIEDCCKNNATVRSCCGIGSAC